MSRIDTHHHVVPPANAKLLNDRGLTPGGVDVPEWSPELGLKLMADQYEGADIRADQRSAIDHRNAQALFPRLASTSETAPAKGRPFWRKHR